MKKNVLIKGILVLVVIALLALAFTGCYTPPPTTVTFYIVVTGTLVYNIYIDYNKKFGSAAPGTYILFNVPIGTHFFEAIDTWGWTWGYDSATQYITAGVNYVYLNP